MRHPILTLTMILGGLVLVSTPASAQTESDGWRAKVDRLIDRWADDVGSSRLLRAHTVLHKHLQDEPGDGEAHLEIARVKLALPPLRMRDAHKAADYSARNYKAAMRRADKAAELLAVREDGELVEGGGGRYHTALALGYLASQYLFHQELRKLELIPDSPVSKRLIQRQGLELRQRRQALEIASGKERAALLIRRELRRLSILRSLDRLGMAPSPIGEQDTQGEPIDLTKYRKKALLIVFWSSRVGGSADVLKRVEEVRGELGDRGFKVLGVNLDGDKDRMIAMLTKLGISWRQCFGGDGLASPIARAWKIRSLPDGVLLDHTGRVRFVRPWEGNLRLAVNEVLDRRDKSKS